MVTAEQFVGLMRVFLETTPPMIESIALALRESDFESLSARSHKLRGSCVHFGSDGISRFCAELEGASPGTPRGGLTDQVERLREEFARVEVYLERELESR